MDDERITMSVEEGTAPPLSVGNSLPPQPPTPPATPQRDLFLESLKKKKLISLVMIVKNEEKMLPGCIDSLKSIVDEFIICDTGSTDTTKKIIEKHGRDFSMPYDGDVKTKQEALKLASLDYIIMMDADEQIIQGVDKLRAYAEAGTDCVSCKIFDYNGRNEVTNMYNRNRLFKNNGNWAYNGPGTHGAIGGKGTILYDNFIKVSHTHVNKPAKTNKIDRILPHLLEATKNGSKDKRAWFYLARTYKDTKKYIKAIECYETYLGLNSYEYDDEKWQAYYDIELCNVNIGKKPFLDDMVKINSNRPEGYNLVGIYHYNKEEYKDAISFFERAIKCTVDPKITLFSDPREYHDIPADYLSTCYWRIGKKEKAKTLTVDLIASRPYVDKRLISNLEFYNR